MSVSPPTAALWDSTSHILQEKSGRGWVAFPQTLQHPWLTSRSPEGKTTKWVQHKSVWPAGLGCPSLCVPASHQAGTREVHSLCTPSQGPCQQHGPTQGRTGEGLPETSGTPSQATTKSRARLRKEYISLVLFLMIIYVTYICKIEQSSAVLVFGPTAQCAVNSQSRNKFTAIKRARGCGHIYTPPRRTVLAPAVSILPRSEVVKGVSVCVCEPETDGCPRQRAGFSHQSKAFADPSTPAVPQVPHPAAKPYLLSADTALLQL